MDIDTYKKVLVFLTSGVIGFSCCECYYNHKDSYEESSSNCDDSYQDSSSDCINTNISNLVTTAATSKTLATSYTTSTSSILTTDITTMTIPNTTSFIISDNLSSNDSVILEHFKSLGDEIRNNLDSSDLLEKGKAYFVYCVDFLFYDSSINGIKFSDISNSAKQMVLKDVTLVDDLICSKFPNYKDTISEGASAAYNKASDIIRAGSDDVRNFSKEQLGEENYNKIGEVKDMFVDQTISDFQEFLDILGKGKTKVKNWYEGLR